MSLHHICQTCYEMLYVRARDSPTRGLEGGSQSGRQVVTPMQTMTNYD